MSRFVRRRWVCLAGLLAAPGPARAHAILVESDPRHEARVPAGPRTLTLRFNSRLDRARSRLTLVRPGKVQAVLTLLAAAEDVLSAEAVLAPGAHVLRWQVLAIDGHITRGEVPFTVTAG